MRKTTRLPRKPSPFKVGDRVIGTTFKEPGVVAAVLDVYSQMGHSLYQQIDVDYDPKPATGPSGAIRPWLAFEAVA